MDRAQSLGFALAACTLLCGAPVSAQTSGTLLLAPGFQPDPQRMTGVGGGQIQAQTLNSECRGWISPQANHAIVVQNGLPFLRVYIESDGDTTLVIRAPNGQFMCNDDTFGLNPDLDAAYGAGQYLVWVGSYAQNANPQYTITLSELRTTMPASAAAAPTMPVPGLGVPAVPPTAGSRFTNATASTSSGGAIFDNHTTYASVTIAQPCIVGTTEVNVRGGHSFFSDLVVRLRSPSGSSETLQSHQNNNPFRHYSTGHFSGSAGQGTWTLSVEDNVAQDGGTLAGFSISLQCR